MLKLEEIGVFKPRGLHCMIKSAVFLVIVKLTSLILKDRREKGLWRKWARDRRCSGRLTGDVWFSGRLPIQSIEIRVPVALWGVDPVVHGEPLEGLGHWGRGGQGVRVILCPRERSRARVGRMAAVVRYGGDARAIAVVHRAHENLTATVLGQHGLLGGAGIGVVSWSKNWAGMVDRLSAATAEAYNVLGGATGSQGRLWRRPVCGAGTLTQELLFAHGAWRGIQQASAAFREGCGVFAFLTPGGIRTGGVDRYALEEVCGSTEWCWKQGDEDNEFDSWKKTMCWTEMFLQVKLVVLNWLCFKIVYHLKV